MRVGVSIVSLTLAWAGTAASAPQQPNLLYITVDDLRPELPGPFGHEGVVAPAFAALAERGTSFARAYCQQAVCSPSRMSFMTGRYPTRTTSYNFINHIREPVCDMTDGLNCPDNDVADFPIANDQGRESACASACLRHEECNAWVYNVEKSHCWLKSRLANCKSQNSTITGTRCREQQWTPLPLALKQQGYIVYGTSKLWHPDEGGICPPGVQPGPHAPATPPGSPYAFCAGLPPAADPPGWTNSSVQYPPGGYYHGTYQIPPMLSCNGYSSDPAYPQGCALPNSSYFPDRNVSDFAIAKLRSYAAMRRRALAAGNQSVPPLASFVGFRKPHLTFRFPEQFLSLYNVSADPLPEQRTLDASITPWAFHDVQWNGATPWESLTELRTRVLRSYYKAAISWVDSQLQRLLDAVKEEGLTNTIIVLHADHGWSLGENGEWRKFTNWEQGARVPLVIVADAVLPQSANRTVYDAVELVDVYKTVADLLNLTLPTNDEFPVDGHSLVPALREPGTQAGDGVALSMYPRCPTDESQPWKDNWCEFVPRTRFPVMGFAMRVTGQTDADCWRYVEWRRWLPQAQDGDWSAEGLVAQELYQHTLTSQSFDVEKQSVHKEHPDVVARLAAQLKSEFTAIKSRPITPVQS